MHRALLLCAMAFALTGCNGSNASTTAEQTPPPATSGKTGEVKLPQEHRAPDIAALKPVGPALRVDGKRALEYVRQFVALGPRYPTSKGNKAVGPFLRKHLKGDPLEEDPFTASTPEGPMAMTNYIAKYEGTRDGIIVFASHYDTLYPLRNTEYIGANDSGSSTGLLVEIANQLREQTKGGKKLEGYSVWLVWFDGEEAIRSWSESDSLHGSRHLAAKWEQDGTLKRIKGFILADMIGDKDLSIERDDNSTPWMTELVRKAATSLGTQSYFFNRRTAILDDHIPFVRRGVPSIDLIDFEYGYNNVFWHEESDTMDKLSANSLQVVGDVMLESMRLINGMP